MPHTPCWEAWMQLAENPAAQRYQVGEPRDALSSQSIAHVPGVDYEQSLRKLWGPSLLRGSQF